MSGDDGSRSTHHHYGLTLRRLRQDRFIRELTREVRVSASQLIQPHFVVEGLRAREPVPGLPGVYARRPTASSSRSRTGSRARRQQGAAVRRAGREAGQGLQLRIHRPADRGAAQRFGQDLWISVDVCLCSFTAHGHCGVLTREQDHVINDATVAELARASLRLRAGGRELRGAQRHDGRPHRRDPPSTRQRRAASARCS